MTMQLEDLAILDTFQRTRVHIEPTARRVRAYFAGTPIADSKHVLLVMEPDRLPVYYFPMQDVRMDLLRPSDYSTSALGARSAVARWSLQYANRTVDNVGWSHLQPDDAHAVLKDYIAFYWSKLDAWYEEDVEVFVHPRDPYSRVDILPSSRHIKVVVDGEVIAETSRPHLLFETHLPTRYYIPRMDVRLDLLEPSEKSTQCPYKGVARYWSVRAGGSVHKDLVWSYPFPIPECPRLEGLMSFFNEKVDIYVDGELEQRPNTMWS